MIVLPSYGINNRVSSVHAYNESQSFKLSMLQTDSLSKNFLIYEARRVLSLLPPNTVTHFLTCQVPKQSLRP